MRDGNAVPSQRDKAAGCSRFVGRECPNRIELVKLKVESVAAILGCQQGVVISKGQVVKRSVIRIAQDKDRNRASVAGRVEIHPENGTPRAPPGESGCAGLGVGVSGGIEEKGQEVGPREELRIFRTLEGGRTCCFSGSVSAKGGGSV